MRAAAALILVALIAVVAMGAAPPPPALRRSSDSLDHPQPSPQVIEHHDLVAEHSPVIRAFLAHNRNLRLATRADCRCDRAFARKRQSNADYEPFITAGDFNGDGRSDVALLLYDRSWNTYAPGVLAVFNGPLSAKSRPAFTRGDLPLVGTGLAITTSAPRRLAFGRVGAKGCVYQPYRRGYREECSFR